MLKSLKKIENLGVFSKYSAANDLPEFQRFNVIYGDNGSGKTTLSRLLATLPIGSHPEYPDLKYSVTTQSGAVTHGQSYPRKVRVFNADYVEANVGQCEGHIPHILIVGEGNKALAQEVADEQAAYTDRLNGIEAARNAITTLESDRGKLFSAIAKTIGEATSGATLRSYRKPDAEAAYLKLTSFKELSEAELTVYRATVHQEQLEAVERVVLPLEHRSDGANRNLLEVLSSIATDVSTLTARTAQSAVIARLEGNGDLNDWVERGVAIHRDHKSSRCEFCDQQLPAERMMQLAAHFSDEDQNLKFDIEAEQKHLDVARHYIRQMLVPIKAQFYSELRDEAEASSLALENAKTSALKFVDEADAALTQKLTQRTTSYPSNLTLDFSGLSATVTRAQVLCDRHNQKTSAFDAEKMKARDAIEASYLSSISTRVIAFDNEITKARKLIGDITAGASEPHSTRTLEDLEKSITEKRAKVANAHTAGEDLTRRLKNFLGRAELSFASADEGYLVHRRNKPAKRLSESEKTAVAFIYFLVQLGDQAFDIADGVVVIDDPISSLDSSAIYQAFSYLKNAVKDAKQVFILTHNFDFLKLMLNWFHGIPKKAGLKSYFMIACAEDENGRNARLCKLDQLLQEHASEYQYLFKKLYTYKSDGRIESAYHIPNVARKVLETFLEYYEPSSAKLYEKLDAIDFDPLKKAAIYKFANDLSHMTGKGFDPALVAETQKNTAYLLEMIATLAPKHHAGLVKLSA
ncbi:AAA family ATPase [Rhizobium rhizogenes]|uniref:Protein CR006 P-loop domain-containing protein n=1 Tax=Rhizobium rhizogenes NBRC 13257 TaxID=1220581 RepID=A0AA87QKA9_RHIRH|nr:AAA family ATPase [Rhizobium rhizogenes]NTG63004.1 AAA family ATPase [Rhizobium rhizogenes]NTG69512.1 AAA family ATPase [Rhizobium rhizogenes]NTG82465.1 AAA family ATPase [Rhizobium rhizogenes]NTH27780.1 AAA family ATPase [Rhizobium rhizogenes]NTH98207.1 AAA family ATPase [Rhizobium rhizogenes]